MDLIMECDYDEAVAFLEAEMPKGSFICARNNLNGDVIIKYKLRTFLYSYKTNRLMGEQLI